MSYDPMDDVADPAHSEADPLEVRFGAGMVEAADDVINNIFHDRWEDDDVRNEVIEKLCEEYSSYGTPEKTVRAYAASSAPGYFFEDLNRRTWAAIESYIDY